MKKPIIYIDLDGVMVDYDAMKTETTEDQRREKGFFENLEPIDGAIDAFKTLQTYGYEVYVLSTAPWSNIHAWSEKRIWVEKHLGELAFKKLILSHNKGLLKGNYLIDDRTLNGVEDFEGQHIHFGSEKFLNWSKVIEYIPNISILKRYDDYPDVESVEWTKYKIVVPEEKYKIILMEAFKHVHNSDIDTDLIAINQLAHEYLDTNTNNIIVSDEIYNRLIYEK